MVHIIVEAGLGFAAGYVVGAHKVGAIVEATKSLIAKIKSRK